MPERTSGSSRVIRTFTGKVVAKPVDEITFDDIELVDYRHHPFIRFKIAV